MMGGRRWLVALLCLIATAMAEPGVARAQSPSYPPDIQRILRRGTLVVALTTDDLPPFHEMRDGQLAGLDVDLAKGLAAALGVGVSFDRSSKTFDGVIDVVARGEADIAVSKLSRTLARARLVRFSQPYLTLHHALALNRLWLARAARGRDVATVVKEFDGRIGVIAHTSYVDYAHRIFPKAQVVEFPSWDQVVAALARGDIAAAYRDELEIKRLTMEHPELSLRLKTAILTDTTDDICMAVGANEGQLLYLANVYLDSLHLDHKLTANSLLQRYDDKAVTRGAMP